jgi:hypothetical protein
LRHPPNTKYLPGRINHHCHQRIVLPTAKAVVSGCIIYGMIKQLHIAAAQRNILLVPLVQRRIEDDVPKARRWPLCWIHKMMQKAVPRRQWAEITGGVEPNSFYLLPLRDSGLGR